MIDFKAKSNRNPNRNPNSKDKFKSVRNSKKFKKFDGNHLSISSAHAVGKWNYRRNKVAGGISRFIQSYVGKPFDLMLSELAKRLRQSNLEESPFELAMKYISDSHNKWWYEYYLSNGIINKTKKKKYITPKYCPSHVKYNKSVFPADFSMEDSEGPKYAGRLWVRGFGITKKVNVWCIRDYKYYNIRNTIFNIYGKDITTFMSEYVPVSPEGISVEVSYWESCFSWCPKYSNIFIARKDDLDPHSTYKK